MGLMKNIKKTVSKGVDLAKSGVNVAKSIAKSGIDGIDNCGDDINIGSSKFNKNPHNKKINAKLNKINEMNEKKLTKSPEEIRQEKLNELNDILISSRSIYESAPEALSDAEKEYYVFKDGIDAYNLQQLNKYKREAADLKTDMLAKHNETMQETFQSLAYYESQKLFIENINEIKLAILIEIKKKLKEINKDRIDKNTNDRKVYYIIQDQETFDFWLQVLNHSIIAFTFTYVFYCVFENMVNTYTYIFPIISVIIVFYLETVIKLIYSIPVSVNVYASWGEDNTSSFSTMIWICILSAMIYVAIKYNNDKINNAVGHTNYFNLIMAFVIISFILTTILIGFYVNFKINI